MAETRNNIAEVVREKLDLPSQAAADRTVKAVIEAITESLEKGINTKGYELGIFGFGKFKVVAVKEKKGRNPQTGADRIIPARTKIKFTFTKALADLGKK
jgi:DNA-binding protein HU-beta